MSQHLIAEKRALAADLESLTAFTHTPGYFVQVRNCAQQAVILPFIRMQTTRVPSSVHA